MTEPDTGHLRAVPGWTPEFGTRLKSAIARIGGLSRASTIVGVTAEQLAKWRDGTARPAFFALAELARAADVSLDWLAVGQVERAAERSQSAANTHLQAEALESAISLVEEWLEERGREMTPDKKADVIAKIYQLIVEDISEGHAPIDRRRAHQILRLVA